MDFLSQYFTPEKIVIIIRVGLLVIIGLPALYFASKWLRGYVTNRSTAQRGMIIGKVFYYTGVFIVLFSILNEFGFKLSHLLGAAGIIGLAIGFASQTSVSNIISGFFLMTEQPFKVDDVITVGDITGVVLSIDMLSVKIRTFDNKLVRIPNETILKGQLTNITHFPIRRVDIRVGVAYKESIPRVKSILLELAQKNPLCMQEPQPQVLFTDFGDSSLNLLWIGWCIKSDWLSLKNSMMEEIKQRFDEEQIEIPFPHSSIYAGSITEPFPIQITNNNKQSTGLTSDKN
jgi:small-conductance mechanosensitive channel